MLGSLYWDKWTLNMNLENQNAGIKILSNNIRKHAVKMTNLNGSSHIGSILSIADILVVVYRSILKQKSDSTKWSKRDRFILGKGHAGSVAEVCMDNGIVPKKFARIGLNNKYSSIVGSQQYLRSYYKMDANAITDVVLNLLKNS